MKLLVLLGLRKRNSIAFNKQKSEIFNIFTQTRDKLLKVVEDQQRYVEEQVEIQLKVRKEIELTNASIDESLSTITNLENFIN